MTYFGFDNWLPPGAWLPEDAIFLVFLWQPPVALECVWLPPGAWQQTKKKSSPDNSLILVLRKTGCLTAPLLFFLWLPPGAWRIIFRVPNCIFRIQDDFWKVKTDPLVPIKYKKTQYFIRIITKETTTPPLCLFSSYSFAIPKASQEKKSLG